MRFYSYKQDPGAVLAAFYWFRRTPSQEAVKLDVSAVAQVHFSGNVDSAVAALAHIGASLSPDKTTATYQFPSEPSSPQPEAVAEVGTWWVGEGY